MVAYAEPVLGEDDALAALDFAYACRHVAMLPKGRERAAAFAALPRKSLARKMIARYHELFPNGE
jgi:hypothetical protein